VDKLPREGASLRLRQFVHVRVVSGVRRGYDPTAETLDSVRRLMHTTY
jgi:hypothetical protein